MLLDRPMDAEERDLYLPLHACLHSGLPDRRCVNCEKPWPSEQYFPANNRWCIRCSREYHRDNRNYRQFRLATAYVGQLLSEYAGHPLT